MSLVLFIVLCVIVETLSCSLSCPESFSRTCLSSDDRTLCFPRSYETCLDYVRDQTITCMCPNGYTANKNYKGEHECVPCIEPDTAYYEDNLSVNPIEDHNEIDNFCQSECNNHPECEFWTVNLETKKCYLKSGQGKRIQGIKHFISGYKICGANVTIFHANVSKSLRPDESAPGYPLVIVYPMVGDKTVLKGLPAKFGQAVSDNVHIFDIATQVTPSTGCSTLVEVNDPALDLDHGIAIVDRGECKFVTKVKHAQNAHYKGVILLDNQSHTGFRYITGLNPDINIPVVFLLKPEADRLREILKQSPFVKVIIQNSNTFSPLSSTPDLDFPNDLVKRNWQWERQMSPDQENQKAKTYSPIMIVFFVVVSVIGIVAVSTMGLYVYHCRSRHLLRRNQRTACQRAVQEMEAQFRQQQKRSRHSSSGGDSSRSGTQQQQKQMKQPLDVRQTAKLLECPVCLETAWPPKKILQCMQGHIICENCRSHPQMASCPICRQQLSHKTVSRNLALENLAFTLLQQMQNSDDENIFMICSTSPSAPKLEDLDNPTQEIRVDIEPLTVHLPPEVN